MSFFKNKIADSIESFCLTSIKEQSFQIAMIILTGITHLILWLLEIAWDPLMVVYIGLFIAFIIIRIGKKLT